MLEKLSEIEARYAHVREQLTLPEIYNDIAATAKLSKEYKELDQMVQVITRFRNLLRNIEGVKEIIAEETDEEMREMAKIELADLQPKLEAVTEELKERLIPKDPNDSKNIILEIRGGTGGDEASLFAGDLVRMYQRYCEQKGFKFEVTDFHEGTMGGYKEISISVSGYDCYGTFKYESGVHRVQRVPDTETQGRVHTSAATVAVLPEPDEIDVSLNENDIKKETFCSSGAGGQSVNTTYSAVRLTHIPTGIVVSMQNERSQIKNHELALKILKARMYDLEMQKQNSETAELRRSMVSSGDRSAKIRTYNYPQSRLTDHRIGLTLYNLQAILDGDIEDIIAALRIHDNANRMQVGTTEATS
jgi:peptide chain release factor 1